MVVAIALSIWLGAAIVTNQMQTLVKVGGVGLFLLSALLGRRIWLLMIFFGAMSIPLIKGFSTAELGKALFIGFTLLLLLIRRIRLSYRFGELECWMLLVMLCVVQVYLRNPVGLNILGSSSVGARPYFFVAVNFLSAALVIGLVVPAKELKWAVGLNILGSFLGAPVGALRTQAGRSAMAGDTMGVQQVGGLEGTGRTSSMGFLGGPAAIIAKIVASWKNPLTSAFHPLWAVLILIALGLAAMSSYRNSIASVGLIFIVGIYYRGGFGNLLLAFLAGGVALAILAVVNVTFPLPYNVQRALSPFPGTWDEQIVARAEGSTEWRVEMWKEALLTDRWIENKLFGDGLGMSARELERSQALHMMKAETSSGLSIHQENAMINGDYHSGPVQTIRTVGYVGFFVIVLAMIRLAAHAHRQILRARGTEWFPYVLFLLMGIIIAPIFFLFVFGTFGKAAAGVFSAAGMIRLVEKALPLPAWKPRRREGHVPLPMGGQNRPRAAVATRA